MQSTKPIFWLGVWLLLLPFLGIPGEWKETLTVLTGFCVFVSAAIRLQKERRENTLSRGEVVTDTYRESAPARPSQTAASDAE